MAENMKKKTPLDPGRLKILPDGTGSLIGMRCNSCSLSIFPPATLCTACGSEDVEAIDLSTRGTVYTYTIVHVSYGSPIPAPYIAAYVMLEDGGFAYSLIVGCEPEDVSVGMDVQLELLKTGETEEEEMVVFVFKPVAA